MRYILIFLLMYIVYRIAKAMVIRKFRQMAGEQQSKVRDKDFKQGERRNIEDAKFTEIKDDASDEKKK